MSDTLAETQSLDQESFQNSEIGAGEDKVEDKEKRSDTREYIVFQEGNSATWVEIGKHVAGNAGAAILAAQGKNPKEGGRFAATPSRNWTIAKPKVKVETSVTLEFE